MHESDSGNGKKSTAKNTTGDGNKADDGSNQGNLV